MTNNITPYFRDQIFNFLLAAILAAGQNPHPEYIRAVCVIGQLVGITWEEINTRKLKG